jgi:hypothetical protein
LVLAVLPFTAPFPTVDLGMLRGGSAAAVPQHSNAPSFEAARINRAPAQAPYEESLKDDKSFKDATLIVAHDPLSIAVERFASPSLTAAPVLPHRRPVVLRL